MMALDKSSGVTKVIRLDPLITMKCPATSRAEKFNKGRSAENCRSWPQNQVNPYAAPYLNA